MKATTDEKFWKIGVNDNPQLKGCRGMFGREVVFRQLNGLTVVSRAPRKPLTETAPQRCNRQRFRAASGFAKYEMLDPRRKEFYRQLAKARGLPNGYTAAVQEYMRMPETAFDAGETVPINDTVVKGIHPLAASDMRIVYGKEHPRCKIRMREAKIITLGPSLSLVKKLSSVNPYEQQDAFRHSCHCHCRGHPLRGHAVALGDHSRHHRISVLVRCCCLRDDIAHVKVDAASCAPCAS